MTTYNVLVGVVELVEADDAKQAIAKLALRIHRAGFETFGEGDEVTLPDAFESESIT